MRKLRRLKLIGALALSLFTASAAAVPITDFVTVGDNDWAQPGLFSSTSWNQMNAQCPAGVCGATSTLAGFDLAGWNWASITEVGALFSLVSPHPGGVTNYSQAASTWAPAFFDTLGFLPTQDIGTWRRTLALVSTAHDTNNGKAAQIWDFIPGNDLAYTASTTNKATAISAIGGWFYRATPPAAAVIPEPSTVGLIALGFAGLGWRRRKAGQNQRGSL